jgi:transposase
MRPLRLALQLIAEGKDSLREISKKCNVSRKALREYEMRLQQAGLSWPLPADLDDAELEARLFSLGNRRSSKFPQPDWEYVQEQMSSFKGATLQTLHAEYKAAHQNGMKYRRFCQLYKAFVKKQKSTLRFVYEPGSVGFVDYAGGTITVTPTGADGPFDAQIFVAALGASGLVYAEATRTQQIPDWLASHQRMFNHWGGVPRTIVCDTLKSAVTIASYRGEPVVNHAYLELAMHYDVNIVPARPKHPQDKAKVEQAVQMVTRSVLFLLRNRIFSNLHDVNLAIQELVDGINRKPVRRTDASRQDHFESFERSALKPLPTTAWEFSVYEHLRVGPDYHINYKGHEYSVPYTLRGEQVDIRATAGLIEISLNGRHVFSHVRSYIPGRTTKPSHLDPKHKAYLDWNADEALRAAAVIGPSCDALLRRIFEKDSHIDHRRRASLSLRNMAKDYGTERLEAACQRAISADVPGDANATTFVRNLLRNNRETLAPTGTDDSGVIRQHSNLRSSSEFGLRVIEGGKRK